jgi:hypothetical protein
MRRLLLLLGVSAIVSAGSATAALASVSEFIATEGAQTGSLTTKGASGTAGHQQLELGPFTVSCTKARTQGSVQDHATSILDTVKLSGCTTQGEFGGESVAVTAKVENPLELSYEGSNGGSELLAGVTIDVKAIKCSIHLSPGSLFNGFEQEEEVAIPFVNEAVSSRKLGIFPTGTQRKMSIVNRQVGIEYGFSGSCADLPAGEEGIYSGTLSDEIVKGDLQFVPSFTEGGWNKVKNTENPIIPGI